MDHNMETNETPATEPDENLIARVAVLTALMHRTDGSVNRIGTAVMELVKHSEYVDATLKQVDRRLESIEATQMKLCEIPKICPLHDERIKRLEESHKWTMASIWALLITWGTAITSVAASLMKHR